MERLNAWNCLRHTRMQSECVPCNKCENQINQHQKKASQPFGAGNLHFWQSKSKFYCNASALIRMQTLNDIHKVRVLECITGISVAVESVKL